MNARYEYKSMFGVLGAGCSNNPAPLFTPFCGAWQAFY